MSNEGQTGEQRSLKRAPTPGIERRGPDSAWQSVCHGTHVRVNIQLSELNQGRTASWHDHNGIVYFAVLGGLVTLQYEERVEQSPADDAYTEAIVVVQRALTPHPELPASFMGFLGHRVRPSHCRRSPGRRNGLRSRRPTLAGIAAGARPIPPGAPASSHGLRATGCDSAIRNAHSC